MVKKTFKGVGYLTLVRSNPFVAIHDSVVTISGMVATYFSCRTSPFEMQHKLRLRALRERKLYVSERLSRKDMQPQDLENE